jgi:hypothetical protein
MAMLNNQRVLVEISEVILSYIFHKGNFAFYLWKFQTKHRNEHQQSVQKYIGIFVKNR